MKKVLLIISLFFFGFSQSQNIFRDYFNTYTTGTQLSGQGTWTNNSSNPGGLGNCTGAICTNAQVLSTAISYNQYGSSPNSIQISPDKDGCGTAFTASNSTNLYVGMVLNISNAVSTSPTDFFRVMSGSNSNVAFRITLQSFGGGFYVGISKASGSVFYFSQAISYNTNHLIILKYTRAAGTTDDAVRLYVDPVLSLGEPATPDMATITGTDAIGSIDRMCIRQNASLGLPTGRVGLISVSGSWTGLIFPTLANETFEKTNFVVSTSEISNGVLNIKSGITLENALLSIYDIQGRKIESKTISLAENINDVTINPIHNSGVYIVKITSSSNQRFTQKIIVK
ncbi:T9SS type A sorting domain-containing protein [Flavobacterium sp.]|uniref:T9SS type A sorting domain-containing protein n=1 Tax=Flavobacterium sp. TaxID=239 RepID=UPI0025F95A19|nr:T9SS type A sorting domain-containing protein [Flavobacterium sp.]